MIFAGKKIVLDGSHGNPGGVIRSLGFMRKEDDPNYISVPAWLGMMILTAVPLIGLVMIVIWAFWGDNQSRKNYYRAFFVWLFVIFCLGLVFSVVLPMIPAVRERLQQTHQSTHKP